MSLVNVIAQRNALVNVFYIISDHNQWIELKIGTTDPDSSKQMTKRIKRERSLSINRSHRPVMNKRHC